MTLEVSVSEVITVSDVFGAIKQLFSKLVRVFMGDDEEVKDTEIEEEDDNKSPPVKPVPKDSEASPPDLGVNVTDQSNAGESLAP